MKRAIIDLNLEPRVYTIDNFLSASECTELIQLGQQNGMQRAVVSGSKEGIVSKGRTNDVCWVPHSKNEHTKRISARVAGVLGLPISHAESFQVIHYGVSAEYKPHFDAFEPNTEAGERNMQNGGQRLITVLGYLNTVPKGGGTEFPKLGIKVPAESGKLLIFHNCHAGTAARHPQSLHAGLPVLKGEKWAFNLWFRQRERK